MKLVTFEVGSPLGPLRRTGALLDEAVVDLALARASLLASRGRPRAREIGAAEVPAEMLELLRGGDFAIEAAREALDHAGSAGVADLDGATVRHDLAAVRLLAPLPRPNSLRDFLLFEDHLRNALDSLGGKQPFPPEWHNLPAHYKGNPDAIYGPDDTVPYPTFSDQLDYELEICAVVGRRGESLRAEDATPYIAGYTIYNDWSARGFQFRESSVGVGPGISKDFASSLGPTIATPDEFDRETSRLTAKVDGELRSEGTLADMRFSFEEVIEFVTLAAPVMPGDLLGSGTIRLGCGLEVDRYLDPGAVVELEAEGIGVLRNTVGPRREAPQREQWRPAEP